MSETFLSAEELREMTGRSRPSLQIEQLKIMGLYFLVNAANRPVVPREAVLGKKKVHVKKDSWESEAKP